MNLTTRFILATALCTGMVAAVSAQVQPTTERITNGPVLEGTGSSWAVVAWTTNTGGSSLVHYGTDRNNLTQTAQAPYGDNEATKGQNHRVRIPNLQPGTTYYYRVDSGQGEGTGTEAVSPVQQFTTKGGSDQGSQQGSAGAKKLVIINGPVVESARDDSAVIAWTTNTGGSTVVKYGTDPNNLTQMGESPYADKEGASFQTHRVNLHNLQPGTKYYYFVDSGQGEDTGTESKSSVLSFVTAGGNPSAQAIPSKIPLYRLSNANGDHFYTTAQTEGTSNGFKQEGTVGYLLSAPFAGAVPLFRLSDTSKFNAHFYTADAQERDKALSNGYRSEGITGYISSSQTAGTVPLFRLYNPGNNDHLYTTYNAEKGSVAKLGYKDEGIAGYVWSSQQ